MRSLVMTERWRRTRHASTLAPPPMELRADARIPFPRQVVFTSYRDELDRLLPYLPNVRGVDVKSRSDAGSSVQIINVWHGGGEIPAAARAILSEAMLSWTDYATWNSEALTCDWRI